MKDPILLLQKRFQREKNIRQQAEKIAEEKSRELYLKNGKLEQAILAEAKARTEIESLYREVKRISQIDPLTEILNRRSFFEDGENIFQNSQRYNRPLCCAMMDIDYFKNINDSYGHNAGDKVLIELAKMCHDRIRKNDLLGRFGGEEFCFLFPDMKSKSAIEFTERIRKNISELAIHVNDLKLSVTVSIGISTYNKSDLNLESLIERSDQSLYTSKSHGRNCVAIDNVVVNKQ